MDTDCRTEPTSGPRDLWAGIKMKRGFHTICTTVLGPCVTVYCLVSAVNDALNGCAG